jgi:hypothetical protein
LYSGPEIGYPFERKIIFGNRPPSSCVISAPTREEETEEVKMNRSINKETNPFRLRWTRILMLSALLSAVGFAGATEYYSRTMNKPDPVSNENRETSDAKPEMENRKIAFRHIQPITLFSRIAHDFIEGHPLGFTRGWCGCDFRGPIRFRCGNE